MSHSPMPDPSMYKSPMSPSHEASLPGSWSGFQPAGSAGRPVNVGPQERRWSAVLGGGLLLGGLARGKLTGWLAAAIGGSLLYRGVTGHCHGYEALGINTAPHNPATAIAAQEGIKIERSITINRPAEELYRFWRNFENLPQVMRHLLSVTMLDDLRSHWVATGPRGTEVEWYGEILNEREGELIAWRSLAGGDVDTAGSVHFQAAPAGRGTIVRVSLKYDPPGGKFGATLASLLGEGAEQQLHEDLRRFKQIMEAGEAPTIQGQPQGRI